MSIEEIEKGPDRILPTDNLTTWDKDGCVKIRKTKEWPANRDSISLPTLVKKQCESAGTQTALAVKREGQWVKWNYNEYYNAIVTTAKAFIALGLEAHNSCCIYGFNSPEWFFSDIGAIFAGAKVSKTHLSTYLGTYVDKIQNPHLRRLLVFTLPIVPMLTNSSSMIASATFLW